MRTLAAISFAVAACGDDEPAESADAAVDAPPCEVILGDLAAEPQAVVELRGEGGTPMPLEDGDDVPLIRPPQGGHVVFIGARITNFCGNNAQLRGWVRHASDGNLVAFEGRTLDFNPIKGDEAWGRPSYAGIAGVTNVPVCPNNTGRPLLGGPVLISAEIADRQGRIVASPEIAVNLVCTQESKDCRGLCTCECDENYDLGNGCDLPERTDCRRFTTP
ncbi:MAG: hypothetical protein AABZ30_15735 [Myxococcota bacterium]